MVCETELLWVVLDVRVSVCDAVRAGVAVPLSVPLGVATCVCEAELAWVAVPLCVTLAVENCVADVVALCDPVGVWVCVAV